MKDENNKKKAENLFIEGLNKLQNKEFLYKKIYGRSKRTCGFI